MLPFGESKVGVGGVTVISGGNLVIDEGIKSFGIVGRMRVFTLVLSALFCWLPKDCELELTSGLEPEAEEKRIRKRISGVFHAYICHRRENNILVKKKSSEPVIYFTAKIFV